MRRALYALGLAALTLLAGSDSLLEAQAGTRVRLEAVPGMKASYRVREQLAGFDLPNDAVGTTEAVTGALVLLPDGTFDVAQSKLTVELKTLTSDQSMRDNYIKGRTLEVEKFPTAEFVPRRVQGLTLPLASTGKASFQLIGDMTTHGVTKEITWAVDAVLSATEVTGKATTTFPFDTFGMQIPKVSRVLSVNDSIQLELELLLKRSTS